MYKFEDLIQQRRFRKSIEKVVLNVKYTNNWLDNKLNPIFKSYGIYSQHFNILSIVNGQRGNPILPKDIKSKMLENTRDLTRLMDKLQNLKWIDRQQNPENKRQKLITITSEGNRVWLEIKTKIEGAYETFDVLTENEIETLSGLLDKLRSAKRSKLT